MAKKAPGFFRRPLTEAQLQKKYLRFIEQLDDKDFVKSCYAKDEEGLLRIRQDFDKKEVKRLKGLKKSIKANRKFAVKIIPLGLAAAAVAGIVFFFTVMANPLLQRAMEAGLEAIFEARVNATRFRISLIHFEIGMDSLTIADRDRPMQNLIQFDRMRISLRPQAVLRGRVYIEEIRADSIRFGTERTVSGALPARERDRAEREARERERPPREEFQIPPLIDIQNFDAMGLLAQEFDRLQTPRLYSEAIEAYEAAAARWQGEQEAGRERISELQSSAEPLLRINVNDFRVVDMATAEQTMNQIRTTISDVNAMISSVQAAQEDVNRMVAGVQYDINSARALEQSARNALTEDFAHLRSFVDLGSGAALDVLEPIVMSVLTDSVEIYLDYGRRALEMLEQVRVMQERLPRRSEQEQAPRPERFRGRDVRFPTRQYPRFFLGVLATDVLTPAGWHWGFELAGVSSNPDLSMRNTTLELLLAETGDGLQRSGAFFGSADFRTGADERFSVDLSASGFPVGISAGLSQIGIGGFYGDASFSLNAAGSADGSFLSAADIAFAQARLANPGNTFAQAADEAIRQVAAVEFGITYAHVADGRDRFSVTTNFGEILRAAMERIVSQYLQQAEEALERALRAKIDQHIDGRFLGREELDMIFGAVRGDQTAVNALRGSLDSKRSELEDRLRTAAEDAARQIADQAREQAQQAAQDALQGVIPAAPALPGLPPVTPPAPPSLPGFPRR